MKPLAKTHITRLQRMAQRLEDGEKLLQERLPAAYPGTPRAIDIKDAATLRHVLAWIEAQQTQQP